MRGPAILPPSEPGGLQAPRRPSTRERFDAIVLSVVTAVDARWHDRLGLVEFAVEDTPLMPDGWQQDRVPLSSLVRGSGATPTRLVLFRRPMEHRCEDRTDLEAMVFAVVVEQVAELLGMDADDIDPRYGDDS